MRQEESRTLIGYGSGGTSEVEKMRGLKPWFIYSNSTVPISTFVNYNNTVKPVYYGHHSDKIF